MEHVQDKPDARRRQIDFGAWCGSLCSMMKEGIHMLLVLMALIHLVQNMFARMEGSALSTMVI